MTCFNQKFEELYEDGLLSIGMTDEAAEELTDELQMHAVCNDVISLYLSRAKSRIHGDALRTRMDSVELPERTAFNDGMLLKGKSDKTSCQITDQGAMSSGTFCDCKDFHYSRWNGGKPCKHLAKLADHYLNR